MIEAHADEIGFMIRHITKDGFLYVERVGGTDTAIARGRRVRQTLLATKLAQGALVAWSLSLIHI